MDMAVDNTYQVTAALTRENRRRVDGRKNALRPHGLRQHGPGMNTIPNVGDVALEDGVLDLRFEKIEGSQDRQTGLDQGRKLLVENDKIVDLDVCPTVPL